MDGYTISEGGIFRPMTEEERSFSRDSVLSAPVVASDFLSSISHIISPRRKGEIIGLAELITGEFEQHVHTKIRRNLDIRPYRDADKFPHRQYHIEVELAYVYQLLNLLNPEGYPAKYAEESLRLRREAAEKTNGFSTMPTLGFTAMLRMAALKYIDAALGHINQEEAQHSTNKADSDETIRQVKEAVNFYQTLRRISAEFTLDDGVQKGLWGDLESRRSVEGLMKFLERYSLVDTKPCIQKGAAIEHFQWLLQGMYEQHTEDILFGEMRCHALLGDYDTLLETADALEAFQTCGRYNPSRLIRESAAMVRQQAMNNRLQGVTVPFVADSSDEHAEYARSLVLSREIASPQTAEHELGWVVDNS